MYRRLRAFRRRRAAGQLRLRLAGSGALSYTSDYLSGITGVWERIPDPLAGKPGLRVLEIGSFEGRSAVWFLQHLLTHASSRLVCIDLFTEPARDARFDHNLRLVDQGGQVTKVRGRSDEVLPTLPPSSFDVIYGDGGHAAATAARRGAVVETAQGRWDPDLRRLPVEAR